MRAPRTSTVTRCAGLGAAAATLALVAASLHGTHAAFTDAQAVDFSVSSGSVAIERVGDALVFDSATLAPGDAAAAVVRVRDAGSLRARLALTIAPGDASAPVAGCPALRDVLTLKVVRDRDGLRSTTDDQVALYDGPLARAGAAVAAGTFDAGDARSFLLTITFTPQGGATESDNDNCLQGALDTERFGFTGAEARP